MEDVLEIVRSVCDPEIPTVSIVDLGIVRKIEKIEDKLVVTITPTYSGCPALEAIMQDLIDRLKSYGYSPVIKVELFPPWTTDWITEKGKQALKESGIAPPLPVADGLVSITPRVKCPRCGSSTTNCKSVFGSTSCKALYVCGACGEPFDYFKSY